jgi:hypothetical protein
MHHQQKPNRQFFDHVVLRLAKSFFVGFFVMLGRLDAFITFVDRASIRRNVLPRIGRALRKKYVMVVGVVSGVILFPIVVLGQGDAGRGVSTVWNSFLSVVTGIIDILFWVFSQLAIMFVSYFAGILAAVVELNLKMFSYSNGVDVGWQMVRDTANMFFILILLAIAFATVLKLESWNFKRLLPRLVAAVLLVNFSRVITEFIIRLGNELMRAIVNAAGGSNSISGVVGQLAKVSTWYTKNSLDDHFNPREPEMVFRFGNIFILVIACVTFFVILRLSITLLLRVLYLWLLVIVSPLALVASTVPSLQSYSTQFWQLLFKYIFLGPIAMFLYFFAFAVVSQLTDTTLVNGPQAPAKLQLTQISQTDVFLQFAIAAALLYIAATTAQKAAGSFGEAAYGMAKRGMSKTARFTGRTMRRGIEGYAGASKSDTGYLARAARGATSLMNVGTNVKGWGARAETYAAAGRADSASRLDSHMRQGRFSGFKRMISAQPESADRRTNTSQIRTAKKALFGEDGENFSGDYEQLRTKLKSAMNTDALNKDGNNSYTMAVIETAQKEGYARDIEQIFQTDESIAQDSRLSKHFKIPADQETFITKDGNLHDAISTMYKDDDKRINQHSGTIRNAAVASKDLHLLGGPMQEVAKELREFKASLNEKVGKKEITQEQADVRYNNKESDIIRNNKSLQSLQGLLGILSGNDLVKAREGSVMQTTDKGELTNEFRGIDGKIIAQAITDKTYEGGKEDRRIWSSGRGAMRSATQRFVEEDKVKIERPPAPEEPDIDLGRSF